MLIKEISKSLTTKFLEYVYLEFLIYDTDIIYSSKILLHGGRIR